MCYEEWHEQQKLIEELKRSREKAAEVVEKAKSAKPGEPQKPAREREKVTT
ncbi:MAG: hypothetical protein ACREUA_01090 [Burkholderiales bacterium]